MTWEETISLIHSTDWKGSRLGLERMRELLHRLGDPQKKTAFIHIAGTNGKGSASAMCASILRCAGFRTGLYISPHLFRMNERMQVNGEEITDQELIHLAETLRPVMEAMEDKPTEFEIITTMALLYFAEKNCEIVVLEVGLGGRLDATNVIDAPLVAAIMHIGLEHTEILGDSLTAIAGEKAGIIKPGSQVVLYHQTEEVMDRIRNIAQERGAQLTITRPEQYRLLSRSLSGQRFSYGRLEELQLPLLGNYQTENAMVVLDVMERLSAVSPFRIPEAAIRQGLRQVRWPGRFELLQREPDVIVDGAHNPNGAEALAASIRSFLPGRRIHFVMGVMADKNYTEMLRIMTPLAVRFITETPNNSRALAPEALEQEIRSFFSGPVVHFTTVTEGLRFALETTPPEDVIIAFGSLYQVGEIRSFFQLYPGQRGEV